MFHSFFSSLTRSNNFSVSIFFYSLFVISQGNKIHQMRSSFLLKVNTTFGRDWGILESSCSVGHTLCLPALVIQFMIYEVPSVGFRAFFVQAFKIVVDSWTFSMILLYGLWDDWPIFMISGSNEELQQQLEYTLLKPDCHSWWISKMQSGRGDTSEERYAIKVCFKLGKNTTETYGML